MMFIKFRTFLHFIVTQVRSANFSLSLYAVINFLWIILMMYLNEKYDFLYYILLKEGFLIY